jgi:hypothetical protein
MQMGKSPACKGSVVGFVGLTSGGNLTADMAVGMLQN